MLRIYRDLAFLVVVFRAATRDISISAICLRESTRFIRLPPFPSHFERWSCASICLGDGVIHAKLASSVSGDPTCH